MAVEIRKAGTDGGTKARLVAAALSLSSWSGVVANYCDHGEHNESVDLAWITTSARNLRGLGVDLAVASGREPVALYRDRLQAIEARNVLHHPDSFDGPAAVQDVATWRELQLVQVEHDRYYHPDVLGLAKSEQLRHYALHLAKLAGAAADVTRNDALRSDFMSRRVPDMMIFGIKLATVVGERLAPARVGIDPTP